MSSATEATRQIQVRWVIAILSVLVIALSVVVIALLVRPVTVVSNFEQCKKAGGALLESYPEQCLINKTIFTNNAQSVNADGYISLKEGDALAKAKAANIPARVIERDGTALPVTMDFVFGRYNFFVKDGRVYKVEIEGRATDTTP